MLSFVPDEWATKVIAIGDGQTASLLAAKLQPLLIPICLLGGGVAVVLWSLRSSAERFYWRRLHDWLSQTIEVPTSASLSSARWTWSEHLNWASSAVVAVLLYDWRTLFWGFFESDDYTMVEVARDGEFPISLLSTHNDHVLPLLRLEYSVFYESFAGEPFAYNLGVLLSFVMMLYSGCILLRVCGLNRICTFSFLFLCINWSLWGEFTAGSYILQKYMQITTCGLLACWAWVRWGMTRRKRYFLGSVGAVAVACFMNPSGYWVPCAAIVFGLSRLLSQQGTEAVKEVVNEGAPYVLSVVAVVTISVLLYTYAYSLPGNQEFMTLTDDPLTASGFVLQFWLFVSTLIATVFFPLPHHFDKVGLLVPFLVSVAVVAGITLNCCVRGLSRELKATALAMGMIVLGISAMVCLGRPMPGIHYIVAAKYLGPAYVWFCLVVALGLQGFWNRTAARERSYWLTTQMIVCILAVALLGHGVVELGARADLPFLDRDVCRNSKLREQIRERLAIARLRTDVVSELERSTEGHLYLPDLTGDAIADVLPELAFPWGEKPSLGMLMPMLESSPRSVTCLPLEAESGDEDAIHSVALASEVSPSFFEKLGTNELLRRIAFAPVALHANTFDEQGEQKIERKVGNDGNRLYQPLMIDDANGVTKLSLANGSWQPSRYAHLRLKLNRPSNETPIMKVRGDFDTMVSHPIVIQQDSESEIALDLAQLFEYSCSGKVESLELSLEQSNAPFVEEASLR
ncbi:hypothetical protein [Rhodopirellula halodulae]|uniref:hypothetical protein n=1 Tax=Rhodopirellula halodulae TaxID=2894198 RepID=UPI001E4CEF95|nr:hypothetical protein [Rhodopirellula sp. JC737]MCC9654238.1 hypothetical protein [Rhodopirellula sp. JC737]